MSQDTEQGSFRRRLRRRIVLPGIAIAMALSGILVALGPLAAAQPSTAMTYPAGASATRFAGLAFDACTAPSRSVMAAWRSSPYRAVGIYTSGNHRACAQPQLTDSWVRDVSAMGWKLIPIDVGLQAPCADNRRLRPMSRDLATAERQGSDAGRGAIAAAQRIAILPGSALYSDIESFNGGDLGCADAVRAYLSGWTKALHSAGYLAGVYGNLSSMMRRLSESYLSTRFARPDAIWSAHWNNQPQLTGWSGVPAQYWGEHQRIKQFRGDHIETHGGFRVNVDSNVLDAPVATVPYRYEITGTAITRKRPTLGAGAQRTLRARAAVDVVCQMATAAGAWDKLVDGTYVPDALVGGGRAKPLVPPCSTPFQVSAPAMHARAAPVLDAASRGVLSAGELAWATCEARGITLGRDGYWARLDTGLWVSGALLARPEQFGRAPTLPLCTP